MTTSDTSCSVHTAVHSWSFGFLYRLSVGSDRIDAVYYPSSLMHALLDAQKMMDNWYPYQRLRW
jgi:hypothetical protein